MIDDIISLHFCDLIVIEYILNRLKLLGLIVVTISHRN